MFTTGDMVSTLQMGFAPIKHRVLLGALTIQNCNKIQKQTVQVHFLKAFIYIDIGQNAHKPQTGVVIYHHFSKKIDDQLAHQRNSIATERLRSRLVCGMPFLTVTFSLILLHNTKLSTFYKSTFIPILGTFVPLFLNDDIFYFQYALMYYHK